MRISFSPWTSEIIEVDAPALSSSDDIKPSERKSMTPKGLKPSPSIPARDFSEAEALAAEVAVAVEVAIP
jgi:hypothetical protein